MCILRIIGIALASVQCQICATVNFPLMSEYLKKKRFIGAVNIDSSCVMPMQLTVEIKYLEVFNTDITVK